MQTSTTDHRRLLMEISNRITNINRETINPEFPELTLEDLNPVLNMVANARKNYLKSLFEIANNCENITPGIEQIKQLRLLRATFEELVDGAKAMETAIERGYLDVDKH